jgi:tRNA (cmo5U34)-methyltransferase
MAGDYGRSVTEFEWDPSTYLGQMLDEIPGYQELEAAVAEAASGRTILELGTGTGETAARVLARNPGARLTGIDASEAMLAAARARLPAAAELRVQRLEDPLPDGPFDLVVSVLAVHHLDGAGKRDLFQRLGAVSDTVVLGDVVVPERPEDAVIEIDGVYDTPSTVAEQLAWFAEAGFDASVRMIRPDLAVFTARKR